METSRCDVLVVGSGAAGLAAAARLRAEGVRDVLVLTESLRGGTSANTGSDKQTYCKLSLCGDAADSPAAMARTLLAGGAAHGDVALAEAALSARCFSHLCDIGVPFPHDAFGQYAGYRTDHDEARRASSCGPYTSREMCLRLLDECRMRGVRFAEGFMAAKLLVVPVGGGAGRPLRCFGALAADLRPDAPPPDPGACPVPLAAFLARDVVFAVGGPGGLYGRSAYPACHSGAIGLALAAGVRARNLPLSQFGLATKGFRWNVSGTYMQVLPRFVSTAADGVSGPRDFLLPAFGGDPAAVAAEVFRKGYQWPFDAAAAESGSSRIDLLVRAETVGRGRRVFLDFRTEIPGLDPAALPPDARGYLARSGALEGPPFARLVRMNPGAAALFAEHGTDLSASPLEIDLCAQHNNGGLAADAWWRSENTAGLWPVGEVNGSHGVRRPGGTALNAGQAGAFRAAEAIAAARRYGGAGAEREPEPPAGAFDPPVRLVPGGGGGALDWRRQLAELRARMDEAAGPVRDAATLERAAREARAALDAVSRFGFEVPRDGAAAVREAAEAMRVWQLCVAHVAYIEACLAEVRAGAGSRGSALVLENGAAVPENEAFRALVQETEFRPGGAPDGSAFESRFVPCRPLPQPDDWFENVWRDWREGRVRPPRD